MYKYKLITKVSLFRFGVRRFTEEVNKAFDEGWDLEEPSRVMIEKSGFRFLCYVLLYKTNELKAKE